MYHPGNPDSLIGHCLSRLETAVAQIHVAAVASLNGASYRTTHPIPARVDGLLGHLATLRASSPTGCVTGNSGADREPASTTCSNWGLLGVMLLQIDCLCSEMMNRLVQTLMPGGVGGGILRILPIPIRRSVSCHMVLAPHRELLLKLLHILIDYLF